MRGVAEAVDEWQAVLCYLLVLEQIVGGVEQPIIHMQEDSSLAEGAEGSKTLV